MLYNHSELLTNHHYFFIKQNKRRLKRTKNHIFTEKYLMVGKEYHVILQFGTYLKIQDVQIIVIQKEHVIQLLENVYVIGVGKVLTVLKSM